MVAVLGNSPFCELAAISNFSFLEGASHPEEIIARAVELQLGAVAIADRHSMAGVVRAHVAAKQQGIQLVVGTRCSFLLGIDDEPTHLDLVLLAESLDGEVTATEIHAISQCHDHSSRALSRMAQTLVDKFKSRQLHHQQLS